MAMTHNEALFEYLLRLGDTDVVLAQRLGEWIGHGPVLEEDIALTNVGLDLLGQGRLWLSYAGEVETRMGATDGLFWRRADKGAEREKEMVGCAAGRAA